MKSDSSALLVMLAMVLVPVLVACGGGSTGGPAQAGELMLLAGSTGGPGSVDGIGTAARFNGPAAVAVDGTGNIYVADSGNNTVRKITSAGVVTTLAGTVRVDGAVDGAGTASSFSNPFGVAVDSAGNVYVADARNNTIRKITPDGGVTTLAGKAGVAGSADGAGTAARFRDPTGVAVDGAGNVYVADAGNVTIRKITPAGVVTTLAGTVGIPGAVDGPGTTATFGEPTGVATDSAGNVYVADHGNHTIRKISSSGAVTTLAGTAGAVGTVDGTGAAARFYNPAGVAVDGAGNVYVNDIGNGIDRGRAIRKITSSASVTTLPVAPAYGWSVGSGVAVDAAGSVYLADTAANVISKISSSGVVTTIAGTAQADGSADGIGAAASFFLPKGLAVDGAGNVYVADTFNNVIRKIIPTGAVTTLATMPACLPTHVAVDAAGNVYVANSGCNTIAKITPAGIVTTVGGGGYGASDGIGAAASFGGPSGLAVDGTGNVYVADRANNTIRKITPSGVVTTLAGKAGEMGSTDGTGAAARFDEPRDVAVDDAGNVYVADSWNNTIRKITPAGLVTTLAGMAGAPADAIDGTGVAARFSRPSGVAVDSAANVYVADTGNCTIRKITPSGTVTTIAGRVIQVGIVLGPLPGGLASPTSLAVDNNAGVLYILDSNAVLKLQLPK